MYSYGEGQCRYCGAAPPRPAGTLCEKSVCLWKFWRDKNLPAFLEALHPKKKPVKGEQRKELQESVAHLLAQCDAYFQALVRYRDRDENCITCGTPLKGRNPSGVHAGHYYEKSQYSHVRYKADNCHSQCFACNRKRSGDLLRYRAALEVKIGPERLAILEAQAVPDTPVPDWTSDELKTLKAHLVDSMKAKGLELPSPKRRARR